MAYQALARKWRPQTFSDIIGQDTTVRTLQNAIEQQRIHHAYLFSGVRGIGKTTAARIFAKALNCANGPAVEPCNHCTVCREITEGIDLDVREIDAATYTGVDNVRELRDVTQFQPARDRRRIFIIDEAHMLSSAAWNALLKILEEPPPHILFMFATTEVHKVPATILSRVQSFVLRKISEADLIARLDFICRAEGIDADHAALELVARRGEGSVRDALSILDQIIAFSGRSFRSEDVATILGLSDARYFSRIVKGISEGDHAGLLETLEEAAASGRDFKLLYRDLLVFMRNLLLLTGGARESMITVPQDDLALLRELAGELEYAEVLRIVNLLMQNDEVVSRAEHQRLAVEVAILKAATLPRLRSVEELLRSDAPAAPAERARRGGSGVAQAVQPAPGKGRGLESPRHTSAAAPEVAGTRKAAAEGIEELIAKVRATRKLTASYLEQARSSRLSGPEIVFEYDPSQTFATEYLNSAEQLALLAQAASEMHGRPMNVRIATAAEEPGSGDKDERSRIADDPVIRSLAKHLGGEVVPGRPAKS